MRNSAVRIFATVFMLSLAACSPQWTRPVFESQVAMPNWIAGLWVDSSASQVVRLTAHDKDFEIWISDESYTLLGSALVTAHDGEYFLNVKLKDAKYLLSTSSSPPGKASLSGYLVSYVDRINDDVLMITQIDYEKLLGNVGRGKKPVGTDLCRRRVLFSEALRPSAQFLSGPPLFCYLLDTDALVGKGTGVVLERSSESIELHRVKGT